MSITVTGATSLPSVEVGVTTVLSTADFMLLTRFILDADLPLGFTEEMGDRIETIFGEMDAVAEQIEPGYANHVEASA